MNIFKRTKKNIFRQIDNRCKEYCEGCPTCEAYRYLDTHGRFPDTPDELWVWMDKLRKERNDRLLQG